MSCFVAILSPLIHLSIAAEFCLFVVRLQVDAELEAYHKANAELDVMIGGLRGDIDRLQEQAAGLRAALKGREAHVIEFHSDLHDAMARGLRSKEGAYILAGETHL